MSRECPQPKKERGGGGGRGPMTCYNCQGEGHGSRDCPEPKKERQTRSCYNCGASDHMSRDCTEPKKARPMTCYNCQQEGHQSRDCTQPKKERTFNNNRSNTQNDTSSGAFEDWGSDPKPSNNTTNTGGGGNDDFDWGGAPTKSSGMTQSISSNGFILDFSFRRKPWRRWG